MKAVPCQRKVEVDVHVYWTDIPGQNLSSTAPILLEILTGIQLAEFGSPCVHPYRA